MDWKRILSTIKRSSSDQQQQNNELPVAIVDNTAATSVASEFVMEKRLNTLLDAFMEEQDKVRAITLKRRPLSDIGTEASSSNIDLRDAKVETSSEAPPNNNRYLMPDDMAQQIEDFLMDLSGCYQHYGCPTHVIEVNMPKVAQGLGMDVDFAVFPTHTLISVTRQRQDGTKRRHTQYFNTSTGYDMYKLQLVDELVRRIASYASKAAPKGIKDINVVDATPAVLDSSSIPNPQQNVDCNSDGKFQRQYSAPPQIPRQQHENNNNTTVSNANSTADLIHAVEPSTTHSEGDLVLKQQQLLLPDIKVDHAETSSGDSAAVHLQIDQENEKTERIKQAILELSAVGPGFYHIHNSLGSSSTGKSNQTVLGEFTNSNSNSKHSKPLSRTSTAKKKKSKKKHSSSEGQYAQIFSRIAVEDGIKRLNQIVKHKPLYSPWLLVLCNALASAGCAGLFFNGNWWDVLASGVMGIVVAVLGMNQNTAFVRVYQFLAALIISLGTRLIHHYIVPLCYKCVTLSAVIWLLQGVTITLAIVELLSRKIVGGTVRLFYGLLISAIIGFGLDIGTDIYARSVGITKAQALTHTACAPGRGVHEGWYALLLVVTSTAFNMLINSHPRQLLPMVVTSSLTYITAHFTQPVVDSNAASVLAAFVAGVAANIYSSRTGHPALICVLSGLLLLVPGSVAVTGFFAILQNDAANGIGLAITVMTTAMALAVGIFTSSLLVSLDETRDWFAKSFGRTELLIRRSELRF